MAIAADYLAFLAAWAPLSTAEPWDNCGLLCGDPDQTVSGALVCLDITPAVIAEAAAAGANLLVSHHPVLFPPFSRIAADDSRSCCAQQLLRQGMTAVCMHTNLDRAAGGVSDALAARLVLEDCAPLPDGSALPVGRIGQLAAAVPSAALFARQVKQALAAGSVAYIDAHRPVLRVAVCGGAGADCLEAAKAAGADTLVTGEAKYNQCLAAEYLGLNLLLAGHYATEACVLPLLQQRLAAAFPTVSCRVAATDRDAVTGRV